MIAVSTDSSGIIAHLQEQAGIPHESPCPCPKMSSGPTSPPISALMWFFNHSWSFVVVAALGTA
jgi:hypothetical protein